MSKDEIKTKRPYMVKDYSQKLVDLREKAPGILGIPFEEILQRYRRLRSGRSWKMQFKLKGVKHESQQN